MTDATMNHVEKVVAKFGPYLADFTKAVGYPHSTVSSWVKVANIPKWHHGHILSVAKKLGIDLDAEELKTPKKA